MKRVGLLDSAWLLLERPETPMHVGILLRFSRPPDAPPGFVHKLVETLRASTCAESPWDLILPAQRLRGVIPIWLHECYLDMEHHVRLHTLNSPAAANPFEELSRVLAGLHGEALDRTRPLWECHVFEGLRDGEFALYMKVHHSLLDGVGGLRLMQTLLAQSPEQRDQPPPWSPHPHARVTRLRPARARPSPASLGGGDGGTMAKPGVLPYLGQAARELARAAISRADQLVTPYRAPASPLNRPITPQRAYALERCDMARIKRLAQLADVTCNDVVLAVCAGALQRLLEEMDARGAPLTAAVPVTTRPRGGQIGTALGFCLANLGTDIRDPRTRLKAIHASTQRAKEHLGRLPRAALLPYTATLMLPFIAEQLSRYGGRLRPMFNLVISNVPGPRTPLYMEGARLESVYPSSVLFHGQALNITCVRYVDQFSFGFTACPDVVPGLDGMPRFTRTALDELESGFSFPHRVASARRAEPELPPQSRRVAAPPAAAPAMQG
jgi:WS/DGAT/MGAT family acyltransferase